VDRIRAEPHPTEAWQRATVVGVRDADGEVVVGLRRPDGTDDEVRLSPAYFDLFRRRLVGGGGTRQEMVGETAYYRA
jgi:hypothetical protein